MSFLSPPEVPTIKADNGVYYDFNNGARILFPKGEWHVNIIDEDSGNILFSCDTQAGWVTSTKNIMSNSEYRHLKREKKNRFSTQ